jgi:hypothetical protein
MAPVNKNVSTLLHCLLPFLIYFFVHSNDGKVSCKGGGSGGSSIFIPPPSTSLSSTSTSTAATTTTTSTTTTFLHIKSPPLFLDAPSGLSVRAPMIPQPTIASLASWRLTDPMQGLRGTCYMLRPITTAPSKPGEPSPDDMLYEMCFGDRIKQIQHPVLGRSVFGTFDKFGPNPDGGGFSQEYVLGSICEGFGPRSARVDFTCDQNAKETPVLVSVIEPDVCKYVMAIATVHACS